MSTQSPKTKEVLGWFEKLSQVPRCSKNEEKICEWMQAWAKEHGFEARTDLVKNLVIEVPASPGFEKSPVAVIQGHLDMVCEKAKGSSHDFTKDPIKFVHDGEWLKADGTTLGADNGIAMAMAMAVALDKAVPHPGLELLFTVDEETGLTGATSLQPGFLKGKILLNVDSEDEGVFTVGCAGGRDTHASLNLEHAPVPAGMAAFKLVGGGMTGGHSGVDIHLQRANAIAVVVRGLSSLVGLGDVRLADLAGGTAHNAIPRDAEAVILVNGSLGDAVRDAVKTLEGHLKSEYATTDPRLTLSLEPAKLPTEALTAAATRKAVDYLLAVPHGVADMSKDMPGLVETSNNLARVKLEKGHLTALTSQRSSNMQRLGLLTARIEGIARLAGGEAESGEGYPSWQPNMSSPLLARCLAVYKELFNREPKVEAIHAGLECGIIGSKYEGMDMISFGPTIKNPHSPDECIKIDTIGQVYDFLAALLRSLK